MSSITPFEDSAQRLGPEYASTARDNLDCPLSPPTECPDKDAFWIPGEMMHDPRIGAEEMFLLAAIDGCQRRPYPLRVSIKTLSMVLTLNAATTSKYINRLSEKGIVDLSVGGNGIYEIRCVKEYGSLVNRHLKMFVRRDDYTRCETCGVILRNVDDDCACKMVGLKSRIEKHSSAHKSKLSQRRQAHKRQVYSMLGDRCSQCGSVHMLQLHHVEGAVQGGRIRPNIYHEAILHPDRFNLLCRECHALEHRMAVR